MRVNNELLIATVENYGRKLTDDCFVRKLVFKAKRDLANGISVTIGFNMATLPVELDALSTRVCN
jgi:hypothetical protein